MAMEALTDEILIKKFKEECELRGLTDHTIEGYISSLNLLSNFLQKRKYTFLNADKKILIGYITHMRKNGINHKTMKNRFSAFSSLYEYMVLENITKENIINHIRRRYLWTYKNNDQGRIKRKLVTNEEMSRFINSIFDIRDKAICLLLVKTGIRRKELVNILNSFFREGGRIIPQMLIISHHREIEDVADVIYSVQKEDEYSLVKTGFT